MIMGETPACEAGMKGTCGAVRLVFGPTSSKSVWSKELKYPELASTGLKYTKLLSVNK